MTIPTILEAPNTQFTAPVQPIQENDITLRTRIGFIAMGVFFTAAGLAGLVIGLSSISIDCDSNFSNICNIRDFVALVIIASTCSMAFGGACIFPADCDCCSRGNKSLTP